MADKPTSLDALFKTKAKKKPKSTNLNAERPPETKVEPPKLARHAAPTEGDADEGWQRALRRDQDLLKSCGLWIKEVEADGACLFRAFADQLDGDGGVAHAAYRERCVDFIKANRDDFEPFLEEDFDEYCRRMREPTTWGGHVEAQALARSGGVNVWIYRPAEASRPDALQGSTVEIMTSEESDCRCVQLSFHPTHHHGQHYNSVRCVDDSGEGPCPAASATELKRRIEEALRPKVKEGEPKDAEPAQDSGLKPKSKACAKVFF